MPVLGHLELPVAQSRASPVAPRVADSVRCRPHPQAHIDSEPAVVVILGVTVLRALVSREDVLEVSVG